MDDKLNELLNCFDRDVALVKRPSGEYQIMGRQYAGYWHIFPGQLFTLEEAKAKEAIVEYAIECAIESEREEEYSE